MKPRISMITLGVRDLAAAVEFYETGLGFPRMDSPPDVAFFTLNGTWLGLYGRDALAEDAQVSAEGQGFEGFALSHNVESEKEVDAVVAEAVAAGATLVKSPRPVFRGGGTAATSKILTAIFGRWPTIRFSGQARKMKTHNGGFEPFAMPARTSGTPRRFSTAFGLSAPVPFRTSLRLPWR
jgi:catechol 2,3-dioxygenase-like lactoylglutathione lyase family enzyme